MYPKCTFINYKNFPNDLLVRILVINLGTSGIIELHFTFFYINSLFGIFSFYELILKLFKHGTISIFSTFIDIKYEKELGATF